MTRHVPLVIKGFARIRNTPRPLPGGFIVIISALRQLSEEKQRTARYTGGRKSYTKNHPTQYNKGVQAYFNKEKVILTVK